MYLGPHHFQTDRKYFENCIRFANDSLWFAPWGLAGYELDREALRNGTASLVHARGVFPEGSGVSDSRMRRASSMARSITDAFPPIKPSALLLLAIPKVVAFRARIASCRPIFSLVTCVLQRKSGHFSMRAPDRINVRFYLARKNLRLLLDTEPLDGLEVIPIARVVRDGSGFAVDEQFVPPCLNITRQPAPDADLPPAHGDPLGEKPGLGVFESGNGRYVRRHRRAAGGQFLVWACREHGARFPAPPGTHQAWPSRGAVSYPEHAGGRIVHVRTGLAAGPTALVRSPEPHRNLRRGWTATSKITWRCSSRPIASRFP